MAARILAFAGSIRRESWNQKLIHIAAAAARVAGGEVTLIDPADYPLPLMDQDLEKESGLPEPAQRLQDLFLSHQGLLIASPEYNGSITPLTKNLIDWVSRPWAGRPDVAAFQGKVAALVSASPGALGGLRGLVHLRSILGNIGVLVLPGQFAVSKAHEAFQPDGTLKEPAKQAAVDKVVQALITTVTKLNA